MTTATRKTSTTALLIVVVSIIGISAMLSGVSAVSDAGEDNDESQMNGNGSGSNSDITSTNSREDNTNDDGVHKSTEKSDSHDVSSNSNGDGRMLSFPGMFGRQSQQSFQACQTPNGSKGRCKYATECQFPDNQRPNLVKMIGYLCVLDRFYIGVCCPDDDDDATDKSAVSFKAPRVDSGFDAVDPDQPPVWSAASSEPASGHVHFPPSATPTRPEDRGCGIATRTFPKITGGRPADPGEWPWMAALLRNGVSAALCGGVLVTDRHVLTAAHCTRRYRATQLFVRLGEYNFAEFNETRARDFRVSDIRQHLDFDDNTYENDIALLKLERAAMFTSYIWPVCMPPVGESFDGYRAVVTGWGTQFFGGPPSDILMEVSLPIWPRQRCQEAYAQRISEKVICAGASEGGRDSCQGDSGGPLLVQLQNGRWSVVGIVSWGVRCGEPNYPGIYTRVDAYAQWVLENATF